MIHTNNSENIASLNDLYKELWLRKRNKGLIVWKTRDNICIPIKDMSDSHLVHTINMLEKNLEREMQIEELEELKCEYESYIADLD